MIANSTRKKNSGILRYSFGGDGSDNTPKFPALIGGDNPVIFSCLGADADVTPDDDDQVFGEFPGHAAITGSVATDSLFNGSNVVQRDGIQLAVPVIDPTTGDFVEPTKGRFNAYVPAKANNGSGFLGGSTKVFAFFQATAADFGASTVPAEEPFVVVQTEVKLNRFFRAAAADLTGPLLIGSIRVAIKNLGASTSLVAGVLVVELQHSEHDLLGSQNQNQNYASTSSD